jgi:hypothetical protein
MMMGQLTVDEVGQLSMKFTNNLKSEVDTVLMKMVNSLKLMIDCVNKQ